jgi:predicted ester cyclase
MSNAATLRQMFDLMDRKQAAAVRDLLAPGCTAVMGGSPPVDVNTWLGMGEMFYGAFPDGKHTIEEAHDIGTDRVALRGYFEGTHLNPFMGIPATGKRIRVTFMNLDRFAGGKVAEHRAEVDMMGLMQQLGAVPS